jgi:hypothetical protein
VGDAPTVGPDLTTQFVTVPKSTVIGGSRGKATVQVNNVGSQALSKVPVSLGIYCSTDDVYDASDTQLVGVTKTLKLRALRGFKRLKLSFRFPTGMPDAGYHLFAVVDPLGGVAETNESNNANMIPGAIRVAGGTLAPVRPSGSLKLTSAAAAAAIEIATTPGK